jgi:hypothetical protein
MYGFFSFLIVLLLNKQQIASFQQAEAQLSHPNDRLFALTRDHRSPSLEDRQTQKVLHKRKADMSNM